MHRNWYLRSGNLLKNSGGLINYFYIKRKITNLPTQHRRTKNTTNGINNEKNNEKNANQMRKGWEFCISNSGWH